MARREENNQEPEKKKKSLKWVLVGAAVIIAVLLGIFLWIQSLKEDKLADTTSIQVIKVEKLESYYSIEEALEEPEKVYSLDLSESDLASVPIKDILKLPVLLDLRLNNNKLKKLPKEIGELKDIRWINLENNQLEQLPKEIWDLKKLEYLNLSNNKLTELPKEIGQLINLKKLWLSHNQIKALPEEMKHLIKLECLYLEGNPISEKEEEKIGELLPNIKVIKFPERLVYVLAPLRWLSKHQNPDGSWSFSDYHKKCDRENPCKHIDNLEIAKHKDADKFATGLSLFCFSAAGHTQKAGYYRKQVQKALKYLTDLQNDDGSFSDNNLINAICILAVCELAGMTGDKNLIEKATKAVKVIIERQNQNGGWDYTSPSNSSDTLVTGWNIFALTSSKLIKVNVEDSLKKALNYFKLITPDIQEGTEPILKTHCKDRWQPVVKREIPTSNTATAVCLVSRLCIGEKDIRLLKAHANTLRKHFPKDFKKADPYGLFFSFAGMFHMDEKRLKDWRNLLLENLCKKGCAGGSWDPTLHPASQHGGRLLTTALTSLCLEIYYRYLPCAILMVDKPGKKKEPEE